MGSLCFFYQIQPLFNSIAVVPPAQLQAHEVERLASFEVVLKCLAILVLQTAPCTLETFIQTQGKFAVRIIMLFVCFMSNCCRFFAFLGPMIWGGCLASMAEFQTCMFHWITTPESQEDFLMYNILFFFVYYCRMEVSFCFYSILKAYFD